MANTQQQVTDYFETVEHALELINNRSKWDGSENSDWNNLFDLLQDGILWSAINPERIIPKNSLRCFTKSIIDKEVRMDVMKFLFDYAEYYFNDGAKEMAWGGETSIAKSTLDDRTRDYISQFRSELSTQISQIEKNGAYSGDKFHKQDMKIKDLEKEVDELKGHKRKLHQEIAALKLRIDELEHPERRHQIPNELRCEEFYYIINYLQNKGIVTPKTTPESYYRTPICYHWNSPKVLFGYFVCKICYLLELRTKDDHLIWKPFKLAFENFDELEKQARDYASKNKNWETSSAIKPEDAFIIDEALKYSEEQMAKSKESKRG